MKFLVILVISSIAIQASASAQSANEILKFAKEETCTGWNFEIMKTLSSSLHEAKTWAVSDYVHTAYRLDLKGKDPADQFPKMFANAVGKSQFPTKCRNATSIHEIMESVKIGEQACKTTCDSTMEFSIEREKDTKKCDNLCVKVAQMERAKLSSFTAGVSEGEKAFCGPSGSGTGSGTTPQGRSTQ